MHLVYVETGVGMALSAGAAVWAFDEEHWGVCVQAPGCDQALAAWREQFGPVTVEELIQGDERAFVRDLQPAGDRELAIELDAVDALLERWRVG